MTPIDAYNLVLDKVKELEEEGIKTKITISKTKNEYSDDYENNKNERIPPELWQKVTFIIEEKSQAIKIHEVANYLGMVGIKFDVGGTINQRDWELDWSFKYTGTEDMDWRDARDECEDNIDDKN